MAKSPEPTTPIISSSSTTQLSDKAASKAPKPLMKITEIPELSEKVQLIRRRGRPKTGFDKKIYDREKAKQYRDELRELRINAIAKFLSEKPQS